MALVNQIYSVVNDAAAEALGIKSSNLTLDTSDFVSLGKQLEDADKYEQWYGSLALRISKVVYAIRVKESKKRGILRDMTEWGAFVQKVYYGSPSASANQSWNNPSSSGSQATPYDVTARIPVSALIFGGKGTWEISIQRPVVQIKEAFLNESSMMSFIDGIYTSIENEFKTEEEAIEAAAVSTSMAQAIAAGRGRNLLAEYNMTHTPIDSIEAANESADFHRFCVREIRQTMKFMQNMNTKFNAAGYRTFTPKDKMVVEMLGYFAANNEIYLQSDTFHNELISYDRYNEIDFWQVFGDGTFEDISKIDISNDGLNDDVAIGGIIAFIHDEDNVAAYFGNRRKYEKFNEENELMIHIEKADKGYAVDDHMNAVVFYMALDGEITIDSEKGSAVPNYVRPFVPIEIVPAEGVTPTSVSVNSEAIEADDDGKYFYTPLDNSDITVTITTS